MEPEQKRAKKDVLKTQEQEDAKNKCWLGTQKIKDRLTL